MLSGTCLLCAADSGPALLCPGCLGDLPELPAHTCPQCGERTTHGERCGQCLVQAPAFTSVYARFPSVFPGDRLIHALKYGHQLALANWFAQELASCLSHLSIDGIIAMPLHPRRLRERGFNQAQEIARGLAATLKRPLIQALRRSGNAPAQAGLPLRERHANIRGVFECEQDLAGTRLLLVDDVLTSGATAGECARILRLHGALEVHVAVVARALKDC